MAIIMDKYKLIESILKQLQEYGITKIHDDSNKCPINDFYLLKFVMYYMEKKEYLPKLAALLSTCSDDDLIYGDTNALMWAGTYLAHEKLLLLQDRKDFIQKHIMDTNSIGMTALHFTAGAYDDEPDAIRLLVKWGADVNAKDKYLWTPLHEAACRNHDNTGSLRALYKCGAIESKNDRGDTPSQLQDRLDAIDAW